MTTERVRALIAALPDGLTELYCHPATVDAYPGSAPGYAYRAELAALIDPGVRALVAERGIRVGRFADIAQAPAPANDAPLRLMKGPKAP